MHYNINFVDRINFQNNEIQIFIFKNEYRSKYLDVLYNDFFKNDKKRLNNYNFWMLKDFCRHVKKKNKAYLKFLYKNRMTNEIEYLNLGFRKNKCKKDYKKISKNKFGTELMYHYLIENDIIAICLIPKMKPKHKQDCFREIKEVVLQKG